MNLTPREASRLIGGGRMKKSMMMKRGKKKTRKHTMTTTKKIGGKVKMRGPGLSKEMRSKRGVGTSFMEHGRRQLAKHGMRM